MSFIHLIVKWWDNPSTGDCLENFALHPCTPRNSKEKSVTQPIHWLIANFTVCEIISYVKAFLQEIVMIDYGACILLNMVIATPTFKCVYIIFMLYLRSTSKGIFMVYVANTTVCLPYHGIISKLWYNS